MHAFSLSDGVAGHASLDKPASRISINPDRPRGNRLASIWSLKRRMLFAILPIKLRRLCLHRTLSRQAPNAIIPLRFVSIDFDQLWRHVLSQNEVSLASAHGPAHWRRVERNGLLLATRSDADPAVIRLFALFHDCQRVNDGWDPAHSARGAEYAKTLRGKYFELPDDAFETLHFACAWHTDRDHHDDPTVAACWDADRLDLGRVGIIPSAEFMSTAFGREIADFGSIQPFLSSSPESLISDDL
jgi:uncharacterized protein